MYKAIEVKAAGVVVDSPQVRAGLTRTSTFGDDYYLFKDIGSGFLKIPRRLCLPSSEESDQRSKGSPATLGDLKFSPRNEAQKRVVSQGSELIKSGESFILQAGTGVGKTVLSLVLAYELGVTTLVVVDQANIMEQWISRIQEFLGLDRSEIGVVQGNTCRYQGKPITVAMVHSICKDGRYPPELYDYFGLTLFDEVHVMGAETFHNACFLLNSYWRIGLSATPDRKDGKQDIFYNHIGPVRIKEEAAPLVPKIILSASGWKCPTKKVQDPVTGQWEAKQVPHSPAKCGHITKTLTNAQIRTRLIANFTYQAYRKNRNILISSDLKDAHLPKIEKELIKFGVHPGDIGYYTGGMKPMELKIAASRRVVLTTYKMTAKAVDCPWWDTVVLATPKSDVRQIIGRILREFENKVDAFREGEGVIPIVFDVVDLDSYVFKNYYKARLRYYREIGAPFGGDLRLLDLR